MGWAFAYGRGTPVCGLRSEFKALTRVVGAEAKAEAMRDLPDVTISTIDQLPEALASLVSKPATGVPRSYETPPP